MLHFEPNDISYVIVSREMERRKIINAIIDAKRKYREEDIDKLNS